MSTNREPSPGHFGSHAIVIGGSIAGLLSARVLAEHFDQVTVIERDRFPDGPEFRKGVPQARHTHILLMQGRLILERLFPGLERELVAAGASTINFPADVAWLSPVGWGKRFTSALITYACSRERLEWSIRQRLAAFSNVQFVEECEVTDLLANADRTGVVGVRTRFRHLSSSEDSQIAEHYAELVIDTSGRSSRSPQWLAALGYPAPQETTVNSFLGYASRYYARPADFQADWKLLIVQGKPPTFPRGGVIFPIEEDRWIVTLAGAAHDYPPTDEDGFLAFARSLRSPVLSNALERAIPLSAIYGYQSTENRLRHYERLTRWPENFVVLGDAVCTFNPAYGQGMTVAGLDALLLDQTLKTHRSATSNLSGWALNFQRQLAKSNQTAWLMATGEDFRYPLTEGGQRTWTTKCLHWYMDRVLLLAARQPAVYIAFESVVHLLKPPTTLFHPAILARVLGLLAQSVIQNKVPLQSVQHPD